MMNIIRAMRILSAAVVASLFLQPVLAQDESTEATMATYLLTEDGLGERIGTIRLRSTRYGLLIIPRLSGVLPGAHGLHVHANPDCGPGSHGGEDVPGLAAGGHYDPDGTNRHAGPYGDGHLGDLPVLFAGLDGRVEVPVLAPRLKPNHIRGRALIIHAGGDNYDDEPGPLGGGGARFACAIIVE